MMTTTKNMVLLIAILMLADMINSTCLVKLHVEIEFHERAVTSDYRYTKTTRSSSYFKEVFNSFANSHSSSNSNSGSSHTEDYESESGSGSASFKGWGFKGAASASYSSVSNSVRSSNFANSYSESGESSGAASSTNSGSNSNSNEQAQKTDFNPNFLQLRRITSTTISMKGFSTIMEEKEYVSSTPIAQSHSVSELRKKAEEEINYHYGDLPGVIRRNTYEECGLSCSDVGCTICATLRKIREDEIEYLYVDLPGVIRRDTYEDCGISCSDLGCNFCGTCRRNSGREERLYNAVKAGNLANVKDLLATTYVDTTEGSQDGITPLIQAAFFGHKDVVQLLLDNGANIDHQGDDGYTALMYTAHQSHKDVVRLLLQRGANTKLGPRVAQVGQTGGSYRKTACDLNKSGITIRC